MHGNAEMTAPEKLSLAITNLLYLVPYQVNRFRANHPNTPVLVTSGASRKS
jgi:hypothetical protein